MPLPDPTRDHPRPSASPAEPNSSSTINDGRSDSEIDSPAPHATAPVGYELLREIGRGGMGVVYRARDTRMNRHVAIKLLQEKYTPTSFAARRFLAEAKITGQLQHPGIPPVHQVGELPDGRPFLAMKLIKGQTLADILAEKSASRGSLVAVFEKICEAVAYAHNHGVIHRDLKPSNVMVGKFGEVQVMDWGLAKFRNEVRAEAAEATVASTFHDPRTDADEDLRTRTGSFLGTPAYMAPEQAIGALDHIDERSDVFGLGGILCAILTGQPPFVGSTSESTRQLAAEKKLGDAFARLDASGAEPELVALAKGCLAGERDARPANAGEVARAVARLRAEAEQRARQAELDRVRAEGERAKAEEQRRRRRVQLALAGAVAVLVVTAGVGVAVANLWQRAEGEREMAENARDGEKSARAAAEKAQGEAVASRSGEEQQRKIAEKERDAAKSARDDLARTKEVLARVEYGRTIQVAYQACLDGNLAEARRLLAGTREDLRGWEWHYVHRLCHAHLYTLPIVGRNPSIPPTALSPDGSLYADPSGDVVRLLDTRSGAVRATLRGHRDGVVAAFTADGKRVVTTGADDTIRLWDARTGAELKVIPCKEPGLPTVSPAGDRFATVGAGWLRVFDARTGAERLSFKVPDSSQRFASFSPDGTRVLLAGSTGTRFGDVPKLARAWDVATGALVLTLQGG